MNYKAELKKSWCEFARGFIRLAVACFLAAELVGATAGQLAKQYSRQNVNNPEQNQISSEI